VGFLFILALGCGGVKPAPPPVEVEPPPPPTEAPPSGASAEELSEIEPPPVPDPAPPEGAVQAEEGWTTPSQERSTYGYRVQIFASSERRRAEEIAASARTRFPDAVYVEYDAPLYKVRIGDCVTRHEADTLKEQAFSLGYEGPWVAETMILIR
jgi:cell division septation protein DedD